MRSYLPENLFYSDCTSLALLLAWHLVDAARELAEVVAHIDEMPGDAGTLLNQETPIMQETADVISPIPQDQHPESSVYNVPEQTDDECLKKKATDLDWLKSDEAAPLKVFSSC